MKLTRFRHRQRTPGGGRYGDSLLGDKTREGCCVLPALRVDVGHDDVRAPGIARDDPGGSSADGDRRFRRRSTRFLGAPDGVLRVADCLAELGLGPEDRNRPLHRLPAHPVTLVPARGAPATLFFYKVI